MFSYKTTPSDLFCFLVIFGTNVSCLKYRPELNLDKIITVYITITILLRKETFSRCPYSMSSTKLKKQQLCLASTLSHTSSLSVSVLQHLKEKRQPRLRPPSSSSSSVVRWHDQRPHRADRREGQRSHPLCLWRGAQGEQRADVVVLKNKCVRVCELDIKHLLRAALFNINNF